MDGHVGRRWIEPGVGRKEPERGQQKRGAAKARSEGRSLAVAANSWLTIGGASTEFGQNDEDPGSRTAGLPLKRAKPESDEAIVPMKSAKTLVTLAPSMEGRAEAAGKFAVGNARSTQSEATRVHAVRRVGRLSARAAGRSSTRGGSPVREIRPPGSVRGAARKGGPYRNDKTATR